MSEKPNKTSYYVSCHLKSTTTGYRVKSGLDELVKDWQVDVYSDRAVTMKHEILKSIWQFAKNLWQEVGSTYYITVVGGVYEITLWLNPWVECTEQDFRSYFLQYVRMKSTGVTCKIPNFGYFVKEERVEG